MAEPCGVRAMAGQLLDAAGVPWTEIFVADELAGQCDPQLARL